MPDFGHHTPYIAAAYAAAVLILGALALFSFLGRSAARRRLATLDPASPQGKGPA